MKNPIKFLIFIPSIFIYSISYSQVNNDWFSIDDGGNPSPQFCARSFVLNEDINEIETYKGPRRGNRSTLEMNIKKVATKTTYVFQFNKTTDTDNPFIFYVKNMSKLASYSIEVKYWDSFTIGWDTISDGVCDWKKVSINNNDSILEILFHFYDSGYFIIDGLVNPEIINEYEICDVCYSVCDSLYDDFNFDSLDEKKWLNFNSANSKCSESSVYLISDANSLRKEEIQSFYDYQYGTLDIIAYSTHWASDSSDKKTDTSIGLETWSGPHGNLHYGIIITNGCFGILKSFTDETGEPICNPNSNPGTCDPLFQKYFSIPDWDVIRKAESTKFTIVWKVNSVFLKIDDSISVNETLPKDSIPNLPMRVRLNCNVDANVSNDTLQVDLVKYIYKTTPSEVSHYDNTSGLPTEFKLYQNYPNPFNSITTIPYSLTKASKINIVVYNLNGQLIKVLLNEKKQAGYYEIAYDGSGMSSGIYFIKLQSESFSDIKKCVLLK